MSQAALQTQIAAPEEDARKQVLRQAGEIKSIPAIQMLANSTLNGVLVLNAERQIVFANANVRQLMRGRALVDPLGLETGEALGCALAQRQPSACGSAETCGQCGLLPVIETGLAGQAVIEECRILTGSARLRLGALDLRVHATPLVWKGEKYCILALEDIFHEKRRQALERVMFDDLTQLALGLDALAGQLAAAPPDGAPALRLLRHGMQELLDEIQAQRELASAEAHELIVNPEPVRSGPLLEGLVERCRLLNTAHQRGLVVAGDSIDTALITDPALLRRVLGNLIKNALEASHAHDTVTVGCAAIPGMVRFVVHNEITMPPEVQRQVFRRSFSTKGLGRGLGTFAVKLLVEQYLRGEVSFTSNLEAGTYFFVTLPTTHPIAAY